MGRASLNPTLRELNRTIAAKEIGGDSAGLLELLENNPSLPARRNAAQALYRIGKRAEVEALLKVFEKEQDRVILVALLQTFGRMGADEALAALLQALRHKDAQVRMSAADALSRYNSVAAFEKLVQALKQNRDKQDRFVRQFAAESLGRLGDRRAFSALVASLNDPSDIVRQAAASALGKIGDRRAVQYLKRLRHTTPHPKGVDCGECRAIDFALEQLKPLKD
jgi:HEAT repeat protein